MRITRLEYERHSDAAEIVNARSIFVWSGFLGKEAGEQDVREKSLSSQGEKEPAP